MRLHGGSVTLDAKSRRRRKGSRRSANKNSAPPSRWGAVFLSKVGALVAPSGLGRPRGRLVLGLTGRLRRPLLAGLATTLLLRPLLTWLGLPALIALLLLALAHSIPPVENSRLKGPQVPSLSVKVGGGLRVHRIYGWMRAIQSPVSEISPVAATQPRVGADPLRRPPRTVPGSVTTL